MHYLTLDKQNLVTFTCPIFDAKTQVRTCVALRNKVWRGETVHVRLGCQACMSASKCPISVLVQRIALSRQDVGDDLGDLKERNGRIGADILENILPVMVMDSTLLKYRVSDAERSLIASANHRISHQLATAPRGYKTSPRPSHARSDVGSAVLKSAPATSTRINQAAATGDMSAAVSGETP